jgi:hypothetical protein
MSDEQEAVKTEETPDEGADVTAEAVESVDPAASAGSGEDATDVGSSEDDEAEDDGVLELTGDETVTFESKVFARMEGAYFRKSDQTNDPVFVVNLAGEEIILPFPGICREFGIEPKSHDGKMLNMVAHSLDFIKFLMLDDPLPKEILTGEASWDVSTDHKMVAYQRLSMQLVSWMSGGEEMQVTDPDQLLQIADDPATKAKITDAFNAAAKSLGYGDGDGEEVITRIEQLAEEICFIETLREKFREIIDIEDKLKKLKIVYGREQSVQDLLTPVTQLTVAARNEFEMKFDEIDGQTGEIISVLKNIDAQRLFIRQSRDELYKRLMAWDDLLDAWRDEQVGKSKAVEELVRQTYRFLAPRFMRQDEWSLSSHLHDGPKEEASGQTW